MMTDKEKVRMENINDDYNMQFSNIRLNKEEQEQEEFLFRMYGW